MYVLLAPPLLSCQLPIAESGTAAGAPATTDDSSFARPLAPPEVGPPVSDEEQEEEEEESENDGHEEEEAADEALVEAVENLLREVEVRKKKCAPAKRPCCVRFNKFAAVEGYYYALGVGVPFPSTSRKWRKLVFRENASESEMQVHRSQPPAVDAMCIDRFVTPSKKILAASCLFSLPYIPTIFGLHHFHLVEPAASICI